MKKIKHIYIISRPFHWNVRWTWEQVVTQGIYNALQEQNVAISFLKKTIIPEYGSILSILLYDYIYSLFFALKNLFQRPDVVVFSSPFQTPFIALYKLFWNKTVLICHDVFYTSDKKTLFNRYTSLLYKNAFYFADSIITTSEKNKKLMDPLFWVETHMIPLWVEKDIVFHREKNNYFSIGYIGKYDERKRVDYILKLLEIDTENKIEFIFAWDIPSDYLKEIKNIRPNLEKTHLLGYVWGQDKNSFYENIHFLYFPTSSEWFGIPIMLIKLLYPN